MTSFLRLVWNVIVVLALLSSGALRAAFEWPTPSAWQLAMGSTSAVLCPATLAPQANPAFLATENNHTFSTTYLRFPEQLNIQALSLNASSKLGHWPTALGLSVLGDAVYSEQTLALAMVTPELDGVRVGASLNILGLNIANYGSVETITLSLGTRMRLSPRLQLGVFSRNLIHNQKSVLAPLPTSFQAAILWERAPGTFILEWCQVEQFPASVQLSTQIQIMEPLLLGVGLGGSPLKPSAGIRWQRGNFKLTLAGQWHPVLGVFTAIGLGFEP